MKISRGYQDSTICANGHIFVIGGSWGPVGLDFGDRYGETYDPKADKWTKLNGCPSERIKIIMDWEKQYRADNHVWLMGWKNNSIFHAGFFMDMRWITFIGNGIIQNASKREDVDNMCDVATMYDAIEGKIFAIGGALLYNYKDGNDIIKGQKAMADVFVITLD